MILLCILNKFANCLSLYRWVVGRKYHEGTLVMQKLHKTLLAIEVPANRSTDQGVCARSSRIHHVSSFYQFSKLPPELRLQIVTKPFPYSLLATLDAYCAWGLDKICLSLEDWALVSDEGKLLTVCSGLCAYQNEEEKRWDQ